MDQRRSFEQNHYSELRAGFECALRWLSRIFDNFRYSKMGFRASLRNDKLILRGVESRDGKEFLVVGTLLPPTVNIISHTQEIGFSELLRRLERITTENPQVK